MERKSSALSNKVDVSVKTDSHNQQPKKKVKSPKRWFNYLMAVLVTGICVCLGMIFARLILKS